ncbi:MAG: GC-type dockerin domain-anchored protein [Planctomycetota bacterium]
MPTLTPNTPAALLLAAALTSTLPAPALAQPTLPLGSANNRDLLVDFSGSARDFVIPDIPNAPLFFVLRGGEGGDAVSSEARDCFNFGGAAATVEYLVEVGTGPSQLAPGGTLRFVVGDRGPSSFAELSGTAVGGGGGGTGLLYLPPGGNPSSERDVSDWTILAVAGGGGGALVNKNIVGLCNESNAGRDANTGENGSGGGGNNPGNGGSGGRAGDSPLRGGGGGGAFADAARDQGGNQGFPAGGSGGTGDCGDDAIGCGGAWGFGGGGSGNNSDLGGFGGGGGGGYSGGGGGGGNGQGGGGGSFANPDFAFDNGIFPGSFIFVGPKLGDLENRERGSVVFRVDAPRNDAAEDALPFTPGDQVIGTALGSSSQGPTPCDTRSTGDVFYAFTNSSSCTERVTVSWSIEAAVSVSAIVDGAEQCLEAVGGSFDVTPGTTALLRVFSDDTFFEISTLGAPADSDSDGICDSLDPCPTGENTDCNENGITDCVEDLSITTVAQSFDQAGIGHPFTANGNAGASGGAGILVGVPQSTGSMVFDAPTPGEPVGEWQVAFDFRMGNRNRGIALAVLPERSSDRDVLIGANGVEIGDGPVLELELDAFDDEAEDLSSNFVSLTGSTQLGDSFATATPSFDLNNNQWHRAVLTYSNDGSGLTANVILELTPNGGEPEVLFSHSITSINQTPRFVFGSSSRNTTFGQTNPRAAIDNVVITDLTNTNDRDNDGIPNACDDFGPTPPQNGTCANAIEVFAGHTPINTGSGPAWFTFTPRTDLSCATSPEFVVTIDTDDLSSCGEISTHPFCGGVTIQRSDCLNGLSMTLFAVDPSAPFFIRIRGGVVGDLVIDIVGDNDEDNDGVCDAFDICPGIDDSTLDPADDIDGDGIHDACDEPCSADLTTIGATLPGQPGFGSPDGQVDLDDLGFYLTGWLANEPLADLTTTGATLAGQPGFGEPDAAVDLDDLGFYLTIWLAGCP